MMISSIAIAIASVIRIASLILSIVFLWLDFRRFLAVVTNPVHVFWFPVETGLIRTFIIRTNPNVRSKVDPLPS